MEQMIVSPIISVLRDTMDIVKAAGRFQLLSVHVFVGVYGCLCAVIFMCMYCIVQHTLWRLALKISLSQNYYMHHCYI